MHAIVTKIYILARYMFVKRVLELAMTRAGRAVGWKSRGLAKDSEEGKRGALEGKEGNGGGQGGNVRRGDRSLIGATFSGHQRQQQQPGFCQTPRLAATPSYCPTHPPGAPVPTPPTCSCASVHASGFLSASLDAESVSQKGKQATVFHSGWFFVCLKAKA